MSDHLSSLALSALADGELAGEELSSVTEHLQGCHACTSHALSQSLLKMSIARAGRRYVPPQDMRERMQHLISSEQEESNRGTGQTTGGAVPLRSAAVRPSRTAGWLGWAMAAALLVSAAGVAVIERNERRVETASVDRSGFLTEVSDQHIATLAANLPPQVLSSDRHTVKPWFQGKIPFSFNLPDGLPEDTRLEGANLTYLHNRPVAQLLYSIGKHRVSIFVQQRSEGAQTPKPVMAHAGFHMASFSSAELDVIAVSDVDPARLAGLTGLIQRVQVGAQEPK
jgi:anti-sigma factor RsiW